MTSTILNEIYFKSRLVIFIPNTQLNENKIKKNCKTFFMKKKYKNRNKYIKTLQLFDCCHITQVK